MKTDFKYLIISIFVIFFSSCRTQKDVIRYSGVYPVQGVNVSVDLTGDNVEVLGREIGESKVLIDRGKRIKYLRGDKGKYALLAGELIEQMGKSILRNGAISMSVYDIAVANACYDLVQKADEQGADFLCFPHIVCDIDHEGDILSVKVSALLCKVKTSKRAGGEN